MESKHVSSSLVPNETTDQPADNESNFTDDVHVCGSQSDVVEIKTEYVDSRPLHQDDSVTLRNKTEAAESYSPQHHSDALESQTELLDNDTYPEPDSLAQLPDTCDMLKEIEDLLSKTLGDVGLTSFSDDFLNDSVEINSEEPDEVKDKPKPVHDGRPKSESFSGEMPSRPPRPKRDATKKLKQWVSLDQHSDSSSCDSASESFKKACPPKPKRTLPPRVNRSQSDVSGMKSLIEQLENRFEESKPAIPPRNESFGSADRPPPLPPRNNSRCNSLDLSSISQNSSTEDGNTEVGKAPPFPKPPRRVIKRPSRKAPPPPPHPPTQKPDLSTAPCTLSASVCVVNKGLDSEKRISYRTSASDESLSTGGPTSVDHDYHEIPDSECIAVPVKEITPPPELPPRILKGSRPSSQMSATNDSDTGSVKSDAVSLSKPDSDDSSSICSSQSSASPSKPLDMCRPCSMPISESPLLSTREHRLSSVSSNSGSFENVNRMNDLSSGSDSEEDEEEKQLNKKAKKARYIAKEIMESEAVFVDVLKLLNIDFRVAVSQEIENVDRPVIPSETLNRILDYLPQLQSINEDLLKDIRDRFENWDKCQKLADVFVKKGPFLKLYSSYIRNFENATTLLDESCKKYASFASCVKEFEKSPRCANLALKHYMLKPIQRIPQYKLLLQDYLKNLSPDSPDYNNTITALSIVSEVADHANESMRHGDEMHQMMEIQHLLIGQFEVIQPGRSLLKKGELMKMSRKEQQPRMFFLFTDVLLYTTPTATGYRLNNILPLIGMKVGASDKPTPDEYGNEFSILSVQRSFTVSARTPKERTEWMTALSDAIKELTQKRDTFHSKEKGTRTFSLDKDFVLGHKAPLWIPDRRVTMCMLCLGEFTITWRRHHCRACGRIVCGYCSENKAPLRYLKYRSDRVCDECFDKLQQEIEEKELSGETVEDVTFPCPDEGTASKLSLSTIKERFQKIRWSGRARKKYAPPRSSVLKEVKANDVGSSMSGYLRMYHNKKWKRFWFVAKNNVLYTYKASEDMAAIKSTPVLGFEASVITEWFEGVEPDLAFQLVHPNTTPLIFRTDSAAATTKWVNIMRESVCKMA
ncbi:FYVE, RhoGEF and PH domain-containing protein 6-like [Gigantopelta aegis]|uniref:FYVE, RhoGEF and PH domain-containing protein 6-like n=1 Tax=Gigantopelta aegis TaxID=1735272 RepID=UPI001B88D557|nr:FYVE, RhoGEF and PH domain-containing protein 6-like [Gigantopelta aegis]